MKYLVDKEAKEAMTRVIAGFAERLNGVLIGVIIDVDGWLECIV